MCPAYHHVSVCPHCGRPLPGQQPVRSRSQRNNAARVSDQLYSKRCRRAIKQACHAQLDHILRRALASVSAHVLIDPEYVVSEADIALGSDHTQAREHIRCAVRRLAHAGELLVMQANRVVDAASMKGPIQVRRGPEYLNRGSY